MSDLSSIVGQVLTTESPIYKQGYQQGVEDTLNDEFRVRDAYDNGYQQGKEDYAKEISADFDDMDNTAYRMGRADGIAQGREDAIDEMKTKLEYTFDSAIGVPYSIKVSIKEVIGCVAEQIKEKNGI